jgi:hypothetical protein
MRKEATTIEIKEDRFMGSPQNSLPYDRVKGKIYALIFTITFPHLVLRR